MEEERKKGIQKTATCKVQYITWSKQGPVSSLKKDAWQTSILHSCPAGKSKPACTHTPQPVPLSNGKLTSLRPSPRPWFTAFLKEYYKWEKEPRAGLTAQKGRQQIDENRVKASGKRANSSQLLLPPLACLMTQENIKPLPSCLSGCLLAEIILVGSKTFSLVMPSLEIKPGI